MSKNVSNELLLETLKQIQGKLSEHGQAFSRIENEIKAMKSHIHGLVQSDLNRDADWASLKTRIERIERRLELNG